MSENLGSFLVELACNPNLMAQFIGDPGAVLAQSTLTEQERIIVLTRDPVRLSAALGTTGYSLGQGVEVVPPFPPSKKKAPVKKKGPAKRKAPRKPPAKKAPARPARKKH
jgi:hypothetical protein